MKLVFEIPNCDHNEIKNQLEEIANIYDSKLKREDEGEGYFIITKSKLQIVQKIKSDQCQIFVWGAQKRDLELLSNYWGEPEKLYNEKRTPADFSQELVNIPGVNNLDKNEIISIMEISDKEFDQYKRLISILAKRTDSHEIEKASKILSKF